jgi:benzoyl-CoA reductase/2-hydroxyglutaryl-CoA dehydratase subunit BcrC/BadD/HgdB
MMEPFVRELVGGEIESDEVEKILRRLTKIREALARLDPLLDSSVEPLPTVVMEDR